MIGAAVEWIARAALATLLARWKDRGLDVISEAAGEAARGTRWTVAATGIMEDREKRTGRIATIKCAD